jgi:FixJ family two-component response regulator
MLRNETERRTLLTARDREIASFVARGATNRRIAERLGMAERSVKYHLTAIFDSEADEPETHRTRQPSLFNYLPDAVDVARRNKSGIFI